MDSVVLDWKTSLFAIMNTGNSGKLAVFLGETLRRSFQGGWVGTPGMAGRIVLENKMFACHPRWFVGASDLTFSDLPTLPRFGLG
jgi:hypothetical protein